MRRHQYQTGVANAAATVAAICLRVQKDEKVVRAGVCISRRRDLKVKIAAEQPGKQVWFTLGLTLKKNGLK